MTRKITLRTAITFVKRMVGLCFAWPLLKSASKFQVICFKTMRALVWLNAAIMVVLLWYTLYDNDYELPRKTRLWFLLSAFTQIPLQILQCALQYDRLQNLILEMEHTLACAKPHEEMLYQRYVDRCVGFYATSTAAVFVGAFITACAPLLVSDQMFPTDAKYPFNVEHEPVKTIIFLQQFLVIWQEFSAVCLSNYVGLFMWFAAARFDILSQQFCAATNFHDITVCIKQHIELIRYAQEVIIAFRSVILTIIIICTCAIVLSSLTLIMPCTTADRVQFMTLTVAGLMEVYACAWPADHLIDVSTNLAQSIYDSQWYNQDKIFKKNVCYIIFRSQKPVSVSVSAFLPVLSLEYYASYVSTAFSYLTMLRAMFVDDDGNKN